MRTNNLAAFLMTVDPFSKLPAEEVQRLSLFSQGGRHAKGESIFSEGDMADHVWILQKGRVEIYKYNGEGRPLAIEVIYPGQLFGTLCRLGAGTASTYPCTAVAATEASSLRIPDRYFNNLFDRFPAMVSSICRLCSLRLGSMQERAVIYQEPVRTRIVRTLFQLKQISGNELPYTKREISEMAATTVETTIRVLRVLEKKNWVSSQRGKITLKNIALLQKLVEEHPVSRSSIFNK